MPLFKSFNIRASTQGREEGDTAMIPLRNENEMNNTHGRVPTLPCRHRNLRTEQVCCAPYQCVRAVAVAVVVFGLVVLPTYLPTYLPPRLEVEGRRDFLTSAFVNVVVVVVVVPLSCRGPTTTNPLSIVSHRADDAPPLPPRNATACGG